MRFGIQLQPFSRRIECGKLNKAGTAFVGYRDDVTTMVVGAAAKYISEEMGGAITIEASDGTTYRMIVEQL